MSVQSASDHVPVSVRIFARWRRHSSLQHPLQVEVGRSTEFSQELSLLLPAALRQGTVLEKLGVVKAVCRCVADPAVAQCRCVADPVAAPLAAQQVLPGSVSACVALRAGDARVERRAAREQPRIKFFLDAGHGSMVDERGLLRLCARLRLGLHRRRGSASGGLCRSRGAETAAHCLGLRRCRLKRTRVSPGFLGRGSQRDDRVLKNAQRAARFNEVEHRLILSRERRMMKGKTSNML